VVDALVRGRSIASSAQRSKPHLSPPVCQSAAVARLLLLLLLADVVSAVPRSVL